VLSAVDSWHERVQEQLIPTEIEVPPGSFAVVVLRALTPAQWAPAGAFPFQSDVDAALLEIEHRFGDVPGMLDPKKAAEYSVSRMSTTTTPRWIPQACPPQVPKRP